MTAQYYVNITNHTSDPIPGDDDRVGPFFRYTDAEQWIEDRAEQYAEHLDEQYQKWLEEQESVAAIADD